MSKFISIQTPAAGGSAWAVFADSDGAVIGNCALEIWVKNNTGVTLQITYASDAAGGVLDLLNGELYPMSIMRPSEIKVRRKDGSATQVTVQAEMRYS